MQKFDVYFSAIREQRKALEVQHPDGCCLITPVQPGNTGPCEVTVSEAARWIVEGSHRLSTQGEADAFHATMQMNRVSTPQIDTLANARAQFAVLMAAKKGERK
jgi:hypothetical protein